MYLARTGGGVAAARQGSLQLLVGGEAEVVARHRDLLEILGSPGRVRHVGGYGAGYTTKPLINLRLHAHLRPGPLLRGTPDRDRAGPRSPPPFQVSESVADLYRQALRRYGPADGELLGIALLEEQAGLRLRHPPAPHRPDDS